MKAADFGVFAPFDDEASALAARPRSLTPERVESLMPTLAPNPEWERARAAGELPDGIRHFFGMWRSAWPEGRMTREEAEWILRLAETVSQRWLAGLVTGDDNQIIGANLIEAAHLAFSDLTEDPPAGIYGNSHDLADRSTD